MKINTFIKIIVVCLLSIQFQSELNAHSDHAKNINVKAMSEILLKMNHFPSDTNRKELEKMLEDTGTTKNEKIIANAILKINHAKDANDEESLKALIEASDSSKAIKSLATSILSFNHSVNSSDKRSLEMIIFKG